MDAEHFEALIRSLTAPGTRRSTLAAAGAFLGGLLAGAPFDGAYDALAGKDGGKGGKNKKKKKKKKQFPCDDLLQPLCPSCQVPRCVGGGYQCEWMPFPDCYGCQEPLCKNGVFECVETGVGTPCGEHCIDPKIQCCANNFQVGELCDGEACCDPTPGYDQYCCTDNHFTQGHRSCWARVDPSCPKCTYPCGPGVCCKSSEECCPTHGANPDYLCVPIVPGEGSQCPD